MQWEKSEENRIKIKNYGSKRLSKQKHPRLSFYAARINLMHWKRRHFAALLTLFNVIKCIIWRRFPSAIIASALSHRKYEERRGMSKICSENVFNYYELFHSRATRPVGGGISNLFGGVLRLMGLKILQNVPRPCTRICRSQMAWRRWLKFLHKWQQMGNHNGLWYGKGTSFGACNDGNNFPSTMSLPRHLHTHHDCLLYTQFK